MRAGRGHSLEMEANGGVHHNRLLSYRSRLFYRHRLVLSGSRRLRVLRLLDENLYIHAHASHCDGEHIEAIQISPADLNVGLERAGQAPGGFDAYDSSSGGRRGYHRVARGFERQADQVRTT